MNRQPDQKIKVSIILPSLNVCGYIAQCLESAVNQTLKEIEILCIDAGSDDGTLEIIREFAGRDPRIRVLPVSVRSYGYQLNYGIQEAGGEYIGVIETDDYVDPDMYECLYNLASDAGADVAKSNQYDRYEFSDGSIVEDLLDFPPEHYGDNLLFSPDDHPDVHYWDGNMWNGIFRAEFLRKNGIAFRETPGAAFQDVGFQQRYLNFADSVLYSHYHFYHYRKVRPGASTWNPKCLRYIYGEYQSLLADERIRKTHLKAILTRMVPAVLYEFEKALCYCDFAMERLDCPEAVDWFKETLLWAFEEEILLPADLSGTLKDEVMTFLADRELYVRGYKRKMRAVYDWVDQVKEKAGQKKLIVVGLGDYGSMLVFFLIRNGIKVEGLADNRKGWINRSCFGLRVKSADDASRDSVGAFYLIANKKAGVQLREHLKSRGVSEDQIMIFDGSDPELVAGLRKQPILV